MSDQMSRLLDQVARARGANGMGVRHGYVHEVKEAGGERKCRIVLGFNSKGEPWLSPWVHTEEHRGGSASQQLVEKGQAMTYTCHNGDYRNATCSPGGESQSNPQPPHAPQFNGDSTSNGSKVRTATNKPKSGGGQGGTSLLGSTEVLTPDGFKNIKDIKLGDKVLSCPINSAGRKNAVDTVIGLHSALTKKQVFQLNYEGGCLYCTHDHEIWIPTRNAYIASERLGFVDKVRGYDDTTIAIISMAPHAGDTHEVFDLTIETNTNFYARDGATGVAILVHNAGGGSGGGSDTLSMWIDKNKEQRQQHQEQTGQYEQAGGSGGGQQEQQDQQQQQNKPEMDVGIHLNDDGSFTARNGTDSRLMTCPDGSKMVGDKTVHAGVHKKQKICWVAKPWVIMPKDPIKNNDSI